MLQLQRVPPSLRSAFTSNRTAPQWQVPECVSCDWFMAFELPLSTEVEPTAPRCQLYVIFEDSRSPRARLGFRPLRDADRPGYVGHAPERQQQGFRQDGTEDGVMEGDVRSLLRL